jgi:hypothetical protein
MDGFNAYDLARGADGSLLKLPCAENEEAFLGLDGAHQRLVEVRFARPVDEGGAVFPAFVAAPRGEDVGAQSEWAGRPYFVTAFQDGELLEAYVARRGALVAQTAFSLVLQMLDELLMEEAGPAGLGQTRVDRVLVILLDEAVLKLRLLDWGRWEQAEGTSYEPRQVPSKRVAEVARVLFRLLTGPPRSGPGSERFPMLNALPGRLRNTLRAAWEMSDAAELPASLSALRAEVMEAFLAQSRDLHGKDTRRHLVAVESMVPHSGLRDLLFPDPEGMTVLARRYDLEVAAGERHPFSIPVTERTTGRTLTVQLLPPSGVLPGVEPAAVPASAEAEHPNLLRCAGAWEGKKLSFLLEDRAREMPLSHVLRERRALKPIEVRLVLAQVKAALDQAGETGVAGLDLRPGNLLLRVVVRITEREMEKLVHRHLEAWPEFRVLIRAWPTMRSFMEPPVVSAARLPAGPDFGDHAFAALTVALFGGGRTVLEPPLALPETFSPELVSLVTELHASVWGVRAVPSAGELLKSLEALIPLPQFDSNLDASPGLGSTDGRSLRERLRGQPSDEPMESMGAVSDFDDDPDWSGAQDIDPGPNQEEEKERERKGSPESRLPLPLPADAASLFKAFLKSLRTVTLTSALILLESALPPG